jgi:glycosyltransferase involved in cell wall biosynthesis
LDNHHEYASIVNAANPPFIVYNSEWVSKSLNYPYPSVVVPPAIDLDRFNVNENPEGNEFITLINLNTNKGGRILQKLAKVFPDKKFLAVKGSYDKQIIEQPENVTVIDNTPDILPVYKQTRLLLMPSQYETWGMTATEAMCSGIPVICCPTEGLKENCSYAGNYIDKRKGDLFDDLGNVLDDTDLYDITSLVNMIKKFDDKKFYQERSEVSRQRAKEHDPLEYCKRFENFLYETQSVKLKNYV